MKSALVSASFGLDPVDDNDKLAFLHAVDGHVAAQTKAGRNMLAFHRLAEFIADRREPCSPNRFQAKMTRPI